MYVDTNTTKYVFPSNETKEEEMRPRQMNIKKIQAVNVLFKDGYAGGLSSDRWASLS